MPAHALTQRDIDRCTENAKPADAIPACTTVITSAHLKDKDLARAYYSRGVAYRRAGDYDRALADLTDAIKAEPGKVAAVIDRGVMYRVTGNLARAVDDFDNALALCAKTPCGEQTQAAAHAGRGDAWRDKGDNGRALADYAEAIRVAPKNAMLYETRATAELYAGALPQALADFAQASEINPQRAYTALWLDIAAKRSNQPSQLADAIREIDGTRWPGPIVRLYLGQTTLEAVLAAADDRDPIIKRAHVCEVNFYAGELALARGARGEAQSLFRLAADGCPRTFVEWWAATAELKALGAKP